MAGDRPAQVGSNVELSWLSLRGALTRTYCRNKRNFDVCFPGTRFVWMRFAMHDCSANSLLAGADCSSGIRLVLGEGRRETSYKCCVCHTRAKPFTPHV